MQINMVLETITVLITLYLSLSLTVAMPCIAHNTQHRCLWVKLELTKLFKSFPDLYKSQFLSYILPNP